jgi:hypothetical protein
MAIGAIARGATKVAKAAKRGRPKGSKKGRKAIPESVKKKAKAAGFTSVKKWKEAGSPEPKKKKDKKKKSSEPKRTRREERELAALTRAQQRDAAEVAGSPRRRMVSGVAEGPNSPALSKVIPPKMSAAQRRRRIAQGLVGGPRRPGEQVRDIGEYAPPRQQVADAMGLTGRGQSGLGEGLPSLEELSGMGGFQITKKGGQIKGKSKKSSNRYKGWGAARKPKRSK